MTSTRIQITAARTVSLAALTLAIAAGGALAPATSSAGTVKQATFDLVRGTVAGLTLGKSTRGRAFKRFGRPTRSYPDGGTGDWQHYYEWKCGRTCSFVVGIHQDTGKVVTVWARSRQKRRGIRTRRGTYLGLGERAAERRDGGRFLDSCIRSFIKTRRGRMLEIGADRGRVSSLQMRTRDGGVPC